MKVNVTPPRVLAILSAPTQISTKELWLFLFFLPCSVATFIFSGLQTSSHSVCVPTRNQVIRGHSVKYCLFVIVDFLVYIRSSSDPSYIDPLGDQLICWLISLSTQLSDGPVSPLAAVIAQGTYNSIFGITPRNSSVSRGREDAIPDIISGSLRIIRDGQDSWKPARLLNKFGRAWTEAYSVSWDQEGWAQAAAWRAERVMMCLVCNPIDRHDHTRRDRPLSGQNVFDH